MKAPQTEIYFPPESPSISEKDGSTKYLTFMITGNPGLIEYYRTFLGYLNEQLAHTPE